MTGERIRYLDGLRGVLAVIVFVHHFFYAFCPDLIFGGSYDNYLRSGPFSVYKIIGLSPINIFFNPGFAIHFFFLLSGYVQTRNYFLKPEISFLQKSIIKRYLRLALPVLSVVILVYLFHSFYLFRKDLIPYNSLTADWVKSLVPNNLHFPSVIKEGLSNSFRGNSRYYQILWTMPTELANSFFVLILLLVFHKLNHIVKAFIVIILIQFLVLEEYYSIAFVAGALIANLEVNQPKFKKIISAPIMKFLCLIIGIYFGSYPFTGYQNAAGHSVYAPISFFEVYPHIISYLIGVIFLFCFLLSSPISQRILSIKPLLLLGEISFMFYLIHFLLLLSFTPWIYSKLVNNHDGGIDLIITGMLSLILTIAAAYILTRLIDKPAIYWSNKLASLFIPKT